MPSRRALAWTLALVLAIFGLVLVRGMPPSPLGFDAPAELFSALRARELQRTISVAPRPAGSDANARAREALRAALASSGFRTEEQRAFACGRHSSCGFVVNLVAVREGTDASAPPIMLSAHHDSVACSPGASDDGAGAAALVETARALAAGRPTRRTLVVLVTDGEEDGLLGAEAFAREHPLAKTVRAVVNVDARGSGGPSYLFETSPGNAWLVDLYAQKVARPATSSVFYEVYKRMPNDTDFTVFRRFAHGLSLASIARIAHYHSPLDSFDHADPATLQHQGDQLLAIARGLLETEIDLADPPRRDAVWFDVLSLFVVWWPSSLTLPLAALALVLVAYQAHRHRGLRVDRALFVWPASLLASEAASFVLGLGLRAANALPTPWIAHPMPVLVSLHCTCFAAGAAVAMLLVQHRRAEGPGVAWTGVWVPWAVAGAVTADVVPGAAWLFVVPALVAGLAAFVRIDAATSVAVLSASLLWLPFVAPLYDALGFLAPPLLCLPTAVLVTTFAPYLHSAPRKALLAPTAVAAVATLVALFAPVFSTDEPQRVNVIARQDADAETRVFVQASWGALPWGEPPRAMIAALGDPAAVHREYVLPWIAPAPGARTSRMDLEAPEVVAANATLEGGGRRVTATLRSRRSAPTMLLEVTNAPARSATVIVHGVPSGLSGTVLALRAVPAEGVDVEIRVRDDAPLDIVLYDVTSGVPPGSVAARVVAARPAAAAQSQDGDITVLAVRSRL